MISRCTAWAVVLGIFAAASLTSAGIRRDDVADASYLAIGADPDFAPVGQVTFGNSSDWASGVLVAGRWFITAAHVVRSNALNNTPGNVEFTVGGNTYTGSQIYMNPGFVVNQSVNGNDIAIVRLSSAVENVDPAEMYFGSADIGGLATLVGYGRTGTGLTGVQPSSPTKRGGTNVLDATADQVNGSWSSNALLADFDQPGDAGQSVFGSTSPTALEYLTAEKDSGAGAFIDVGGEFVLSGIVSFALFDVDGVNYNYGDVLGVTDFSGQEAWIHSVVPETSPVLLCLLGLTPFVVVVVFKRWKSSPC